MNFKRFFLALAFLLPVYFLLYKIYSVRVNAFGCFDDCFNIAAGYFINKGKILYSEIFFNHQMLPPFISSLIQNFTNPINIFELILRHRQFVMLFGFLMSLLILTRFGLLGAFFVLFYEFTKFYIFGDRFLAEAMIVYPLTFIAGILWYKFRKKEIYPFDYLLSSVFSWFVVFMREPFIPLSLLMYFLIIVPIKSFEKAKIVSIFLFFTLSFLSLSSIGFADYYYNLVTVNRTFFEQVNSFGIFKSFFYPFILFFGGDWNIFRIFVVGISLIFLLLIFYLFFHKKFRLIGLSFLILGLANLRYLPPGEVFYSAFHIIPWYGLFIFLTVLMLFNFFKENKFSKFYFIFLVLLFLYTVSSPQYFAKEKIDTHKEFITNYGNYLQVGEVIKKISAPSDTLFLDGFDEIIYWQAGRNSSYKYSLYTSFMPNFEKYSVARLEMFSKNPPDFYYGSCPKEKNSFRLLPKEYENQYQRLYAFGKPTCVFVNKKKIGEISSKDWKKAKEFHYELP